MTYKELKTQILNLGFETTLNYTNEPTVMTDAINRAMREITNLFPLVGEYHIVQYPLCNLLGEDSVYMDTRHYNGKTPLVFGASNVKAFYFEYAGSGTLTIDDDTGTRQISLTESKQFMPYKDFAVGKVTLTLEGAYSYDIRNIALYGEVFSEEKEDIPAYGKWMRYDMKALTMADGKPQFIDFLDKVQEGDVSTGERYIKLHDFKIEKRHVLVLEGRTPAQYTIFYKKDFQIFSMETPDNFEIELDADKVHLLPLLAAWYVWAEEEPAFAAHCRNDYEQYATRLLMQKKDNPVREAFCNEMGW